MTWRLVRRGLVTLVVTALSLWVAAAILDGFAVAGVGAAFLPALVLGLLNGLVWPLMIRLTLPFAVLTFGLGTLALNGAFLLIADRQLRRRLVAVGHHEYEQTSEPVAVV